MTLGHPKQFTRASVIDIHRAEGKSEKRSPERSKAFPIWMWVRFRVLPSIVYVFVWRLKMNVQ